MGYSLVRLYVRDSCKYLVQFSNVGYSLVRLCSASTLEYVMFLAQFSNVSHAFVSLTVICVVLKYEKRPKLTVGMCT